MKQKQKGSDRPLVVATVHTPRGLDQAVRLRRGAVDLVEIRLDLLRRQVTSVERRLKSLRIPILLTVRHPAEGGARETSANERRDLIERFLPCASALDIELRSVRALQPLLETAARAGTTRIISFHDFVKTPTLAALRKTVRAATDAGADVVKIATQLRGPADLAVLLQLQGTTSVPLATMGMGSLGRVSRLVLAAAGSRLNYGYLDRPQVAGQWPAAELKDMLRRVRP